ncbi:MAG: hypothetical protein WA004_12575, partial [Saprospiraceae bacterium]
MDPNGDGGFENGASFAANGWTVDNGAQTNAWYVGGVPTGTTGARSAYVSNDGGTTWTYNITAASVVHFWRDITFPAGEDEIQLSFSFDGDGESTLDRIRIYLVETTTTPVAGTELSTGQIGLPNYNQQKAGFIKTGFRLPAGTAGTTKRLVISWRNDLSIGTMPPGGIDNIRLTSQAPPTMSGAYTINNTLPTAGTNFNGFVDAFNQLNGATITGPVTINVSAGQSFKEIPPVLTATGTAANPIVIQKSGAGANPVLISSGFSSTTDPAICLSGSDYMTFDGIDIGLAGPAVVNLEYGYLVRNATATNGASNNTIRNCTITMANSNTSSRGILQSATTTGGGVAPTSADGSNNNNIYENLTVQTVHTGIYLLGTAGFPELNCQVRNNIVGGPNANDIGGATTTQPAGIRAANVSGVKIFNNLVRNVGAGAIVDGIFLELFQGNSEVYGNTVNNVRNTSTTSTSVASGIKISHATTGTHNVRIFNNFVYDITSAYTSTATATRVLRGIHIIGTGGGITQTYDIVHNSVRIDGSGSPNVSSVCFEISTTSGPVYNIQNNILSNFTGAQTGVAVHFVWRSTSATQIGNLGSVSNYNVLHVNNPTNGFIAQGNTTNYATLADWQAATGQDLNSWQQNPRFVSATDLHISASVATPVESNGTPIAFVTTDIDGNARNAATPDIGADEGSFLPLLNNDIAAQSFVTPQNGGAIIQGANFTPTAIYENAGSLAQTNIPVRFRILGPAPSTTVVYEQTASIASLAAGASQSVAFTVTSLATPGFYTMEASSELAGDQNSANNLISGTFESAGPLNGVYQVGASQTAPFNTLTNAVSRLNTVGVSGPVTFRLTDATYPAETFPLVINPIQGGSPVNNLTIAPQATTLISGSAAGCLIALAGADYVTIDGSNSGATDRSLTVENTSTAANSAVICVQSLGAGAGATNNTLKNLNVIAGSNVTTSTFGIFSAGSAVSTSGTGDDNDNLVIQNNSIKRTYYGIYTRASGAAGQHDGLQITGNDIGSEIPNDYVVFRGVQVQYANGPVISQNNIFSMKTTNSISIAAIDLAAGVLDGQVTRNNITGIHNTSSSGWSAYGVLISTTTGPPNNNLIANNFISDILTANYSTTSTTFNAFGIRLTGGTNTKVYNNSIHMFGPVTAGSSAGSSANMVVTTTSVTGLDMRNNVFVNTQDFGVAGSAAMNIWVPTGFVFSNTNNNDYYGLSTANTTYGVAKVGTAAGAPNYLTLGDWQGFTLQDANSIAVAPVFVSNTDLHMVTNQNLLIDGGAAPLAEVTVDFDGEARAATPDIGADEFTNCDLPANAVNITITADPSNATICGQGSVTLTASGANTYFWSPLDGLNTNIGSTVIASPLATTTYTVEGTNTTTGCVGTAQITVNVFGLPNAQITPAQAAICPGEEVTLTASGGVSYSWNTDQSSASITVSPNETTTYSVEVTDANGCTAIALATVTVNQPPVIQAAITEPTACTSTNGAINLTITGTSPYIFTWATPNGNGLVQGQEDQSGLTVGTYFVTVEDANGCVSNASYTLLGPGGCEVCPLFGALTANPSPACQNETITLTQSGMTNMGITYGVQFKYSTSPLADPYNGGTTIATVPNGNLTNLGSVASTTTSFAAANTYFIYTILDPVPLDPTCRPSATATLVVNPVPTVNAVSSQVRCNGAATAAVTFSGAVPGTLYSWTNSNPSIGLAANGTGDIPSFIATNNGTSPVVATITVTPSYSNAGGTCTGAPITFTYTVNPTPSVNNPGNQIVCAGAPVTVNFTGSVGGTVYNWTNSNTSIGLAASGSGNISFTTVNNTGVTQVATIVVTPSYSNASTTCPGGSQTFTITVNPLPSMNQPASQEVCGGNATQAVNFSSSATGTTFSWTNNNTSIGLAASGSGNIPAFTAVNNTGVTQVATITVTPSFTSAGLTCQGNAVTFTITVFAPSSANAGLDQTICQNQSASLSATVGGSATGGTWSGGAGSFSNPTSLTTSYTPAASEYGTTVTLTFTTNDPAGPCTAASDFMLLTINTLPEVFAGEDTKVCEGDNLNLTTLGAFINANGSGVTTGTWSTSGSGTFQPTNAFPGATAYVPSAADIAAGTVTITLTSADPTGPCGAVSDAFFLRFKGDEPLTCNDLVQVSLDGDGESEVFPDMILEGTYDLQFYSVEIYNGVNFIGNTVDCGDIGKTFTVKVVDICTGNFCWGSIVVEDKWAPEVLCNEVTIPCSADYNNVPFPLATDNCDISPEVELTSVTVLDQDLCADNQVVVLRTFIAIDNYGNESAECTQTIIIQRPAFVDFPNDIEWECSVYNQNPGVTAPTAAGSGIPFGLDGEYCMYAYSSSDQILPSCGTTFKIVRTWTVLDWCTGQVITSNPQGEDNVQIIKIVDTTPPVVTLAPYNVPANITGVHPQPCTSTGFLQPADITDNCNAFTVKIFTPIGEAVYLNGVDGAAGGFIPYPGLGLGTHIIQYQVEDACNNINDFFVAVTVVDNIVPTAICDEITDTNLSSDGIAAVYAETFDDGSYDNCCLDYFEVRRMNGDCNGNFDDFGPYVEFCCSDAGTAVMVVFRAYDCNGNYNDCMVTVNVSDKLPPILISCPQGQTITCDTYLQNYAAGVEQGDYSVLNGFGSPQFFDNCNFNLTSNVTVNLDNCTKGTITRSWTASDPNGQATCTQVIQVTHVSNWVVEFPADVTAVCTNGQLPDTGEPEIFFDECELIGVSHSDQVFTVVPDACYKIVRTWNVINWCIYDNFGYNAYSEDGKAECNLNVDWDGDGDKDCRTFRDGWNSTGSPGTPDGFISYKQTIKVMDNEDPTFTVDPIDGCIVSTGCTKTITLPYPNITDDCSLTYDVDITGDFGTFNNITAAVNVPNVGVGEYEVTYAVTDNCGNTGYLTIVVVVEDCKKPTPLCDNGLVVEIMQTGMVEVCAEAFDEGSWDNCGPIAHFSYSPDITNTCQIFDCDDVLVNPTVQIWVTDIYGNQDYCET